MSFSDLPSDWPDLPVEGERHIADILDLMVGDRARRNGALLILMCDEQRRPLQPILIEDLDADAPRPLMLDEGLRTVAAGIAELAPRCSALVALARDGSLQVSVMDRAWFDAIKRAFSGEVELIGVHLITPRGSTSLTDLWAA
jgi:hypothetical protein